MSDHKPGKDAGVRELAKRLVNLTTRVEGCKRAIYNLNGVIASNESAREIEEKKLAAAEKELATVNRRYVKAYNATLPKKKRKKKAEPKKAEPKKAEAKKEQIAGGAKGGSKGRVEAKESTTGEPGGPEKADKGKSRKKGQAMRPESTDVTHRPDVPVRGKKQGGKNKGKGHATTKTKGK